MNKKIILKMLIAMLVCIMMLIINEHVFAAELFSITLNADKTTVKPGDTVKVTVRLSNIASEGRNWSN